MSFYGLITLFQEYNFITDYIKPKLNGSSWLFPIGQMPPRVEFLQNLLQDLKKT